MVLLSLTRALAIILMSYLALEAEDLDLILQAMTKIDNLKSFWLEGWHDAILIYSLTD